MFNFLHPRPVVDGRAVAVKIVQQKASTRQDARTLILPAKDAGSADSSQKPVEPRAEE